MTERVYLLIFFCFGICLFCLLLGIIINERILVMRKRKIRKILLKRDNVQADCTKRISLNGEKYFIFSNFNERKEYLVNKKGEIRGFKRF